ncbi:MFS transporter [Modestobacter versicolor]|uniref:MFS transporter n=1 Tax=Modestobacter versicolor TaxID=429133 RepID=UPI0034DFB73D
MPRPQLPRPAAFWTVAVLLVLMLGASGVPSPLYRVYAEEFGFGSGTLTVVFAVYAFALLASLLVVGALSDHVGRRPVLAAALVLEAVSMVMFLVADGVGWLLAARVAQGLATGAFTGAVGAALLDLQRVERPLGPLVNAAAPGLGLSLGAVGAGLAVEFLPSPTDWVFGLLTVLCLVAAVGVWVSLPESSPRRAGTAASLVPSVHVPASQRRAFVVVLPCLVATWALGGLYLSLGPSLVADVFDRQDHVSGSLLILALNGTAVVGSLSLGRVSPTRGMVVGALSFVVGVLTTITALAVGSLALLFVAAVVSGFGFGGAFLGAMATVTAGVDPGERGALLAAVFTASYLGFSLPSIAAGIAAGHIGLERTAQLYGAFVIVLALSAVAGLAVRSRRPAVAPAPAVGPAAAPRPSCPNAAAAVE